MADKAMIIFHKNAMNNWRKMRNLFYGGSGKQIGNSPVFATDGGTDGTGGTRIELTVGKVIIYKLKLSLVRL